MKRMLLQSEILSCGCPTRFLPQSDPDIHLCHEKEMSLLEAYNRLFLEIRSGFSPERILEVGVKKGGSLALWRDRFGCEVVGVDRAAQIHPFTKAHFEHAGGITVVHGEATDSKFMNQLGLFDLIIDDGSHSFSDISNIFDFLWGRVKPGGLYAIEDWKLGDAKFPVLAEKLLSIMVGYWPNKELPKNSPKSIMYFRDVIILEKQ